MCYLMHYNRIIWLEVKRESLFQQVTKSKIMCFGWENEGEGEEGVVNVG